MKLNVKLSSEIARIVKPKRKECYLNSFTAWSHMPEGTMYCEGQSMICSLGVPLEHGWLELPDGEIVDVTWYKEAPVVYEPIWKFTIKEALAMMEKDRTLPIGWKLRNKTVQDMIDAIARCVEKGNTECGQQTGE